MTNTNHTYFMHLKTTAEWLSLPAAQRHGFVETTIQPLLACHPDVSLRYFDTHAFDADVSDIAVWETSDVDAYQSLMQELRETDFWIKYFTIARILPSIENPLIPHEHPARSS